MYTNHTYIKFQRESSQGAITPEYGEDDEEESDNNALLEELLDMVTIVRGPRSGKDARGKYRIRKKSASEIPGKQSLKRG